MKKLSKEELEQLKQQLKEEEEKRELETEIAAIQARINKSIETQTRLDKARSRYSSIVKSWLKENGYWNSFILFVPGIILFEVGAVIMPYPLGMIGGLMIVGAILLTPFLRPFWDNKYRPPNAKLKR